MTAGSTTRALAMLTDWQSEVTLVPFSGLQFLDFGFRLDTLDLRPRRFIERVAAERPDGVEWKLIPLTGDEETDEPVLSAARPDDREYAIRPVAAMEPFLAKWLPLPVLRLRNETGPGGEPLFDPGPTNWARIRTVELESPDPATGHTHRVQIAFDTALLPEERNPGYVAPSPEDSEKRREFRFVSDHTRMDWFLRRQEDDGEGGIIDPQAWVSEWLEEVFLDFKRAERPGRRITRDTLEREFEHWARYLAYLALIDAAVRVPRLILANTVGARDRAVPVAVDLVIDIGNSRTCGIFIERFPGEPQLDLARSYPLQLRDLSRPELVHTGLFESRIEFAEHHMGDVRFGRRTRRGAAFGWPSFARIGPEAMRFVSGETGTESASGLSSPKRYLWDMAPRPQDWRFHDHGDPANLPRSVRSAMVHLNALGEVIEQVKADEKAGLRKRDPALHLPASRPRFAHSTLFCFMLSEIIAHALVQVNDPANRARRAFSALPRKLSRIILTLPTATSAQEHAIMRARANGALKLVWALSGLGGSNSVLEPEPELNVEWDEASCTQLVYLYSELNQKFDGRIEAYLRLVGRERAQRRGEAATPSLRVASIDIGGGTTDLMVTTYWGQDDRMLDPEQTFREGFRIAGDELLQRIITGIVLPQIEQGIVARGGSHVRGKLIELFGGELGGRDQQLVQQRRQFAQRVLMPIGIEVLRLCEAAAEGDRLQLDLGDLFGSGPARDAGARNDVPDGLLAYLEQPAADLGARGFRLRELLLHWTRSDVDALTREVFQPMLGNLAEVIDHLGADVVLLTGRPSRLPAVRAIVEEMLVVPPHRLISMHHYRTGKWYPFRNPITHRIGDPKSTVAVGGLLLSLCDSWVPNFKVATNAFRMRSTARFIGEMEKNGQILDRKLLFANLDLDSAQTAQVATLRMFAPVYIGSRQLPLERWTTTPLYRLDFANAAANAGTPLTIQLERSDIDEDIPEGPAQRSALLRREVQREAFRVTEVQDNGGNPRRASDVVLQLQTLGFADFYWIDSGLFQI